MLKDIIKEIIAEELGASKPTRDSGPAYSGRMIVELEQGFVYYGDVRVENDIIVGTNGGQVRRWVEPDGGLPALCSRQPSEKTTLDPCEKWSAPISRIICVMPIEKGGI